MKSKDKYVINSFKELYTEIKNMSEKELLVMINYEVVKYKRAMVIERLHMRYSKLRNARERKELKQGLLLL